MMPKLPLETLKTKLSPEDFLLVEGCCKKDHILYTSKPKKDGTTQYLWRMLVFALSDKSQHKCMPVTAEWDLPQKNYPERRIEAKRLDALCDQILECIPASQWKGYFAWGHALGML